MFFTFGMAAFILSLIGVIIPFYGIMVGWAALFLACIGALMGERVLVLATIGVCVINFLFISPLFVSAIGPIDNNFIEISMIMLAAPIVCLMLRKLSSIAK